jgi:uncharacterized protein (DUF4415 family)
MNEKRKSISSDLKKLDKMKDADIDYSDIPSLDDSFFRKEIVELPKKKDSVTLRIDHDVLEFYKGQGRGYQTLMNAVLKVYARAKQKEGQGASSKTEARKSFYE